VGGEACETVRAVRLEIARLEGAQQAQADASRALESLCIKLGMAAPGGRVAAAGACLQTGCLRSCDKPEHGSAGAKGTSWTPALLPQGW
jgi:hypothetical protein